MRAGLRHQIDFRTLQLGVVEDYTPDPASLSFSVSTPPKKKTRQITPRPKLGIHLPLLLSGASFFKPLEAVAFFGGEGFLGTPAAKMWKFRPKNLFF